jgi:hypothetical protein
MSLRIRQLSLALSLAFTLLSCFFSHVAVIKENTDQGGTHPTDQGGTHPDEEDWAELCDPPELRHSLELRIGWSAD